MIFDAWEMCANGKDDCELAPAKTFPDCRTTRSCAWSGLVRHPQVTGV